MIRITSNYLKQSELALFKRFCHFTLKKLVTPAMLRKSNISIRIVAKGDLVCPEEIKDFKTFGAWMTNDGIVEGKRKFEIVLNANRLKHNAVKPLYRLKYLMHDVAHELTHVKQYLKNEIFDYADGRARYKGEVFESSVSSSESMEEDYYNSPWEIEAYGREHGMFKMFKTHLKKKTK